MRKLHFKKLDAEQKELLDNLLDSYEDLPLHFNGTEAEFIREMLKEALDKISEFTSKIFENFHTIGNEIVCKYRAELMSTFSRDHVPILPWSVMKQLNGDVGNFWGIVICLVNNENLLRVGRSPPNQFSSIVVNLTK